MSDPTRPGDDAEAIAEAEGVEDPLGPPAEGDGPAGDDAEPADAGAERTGSAVEELIADLERTAAERDDYLDKWRRNQADFENSRKRLIRDAADAGARATEALVEKLLPVLDACDGAISHGATEVEPIFATLLGSLEKEGLTRLDPDGEAFDPNLHEAVLHEPAGDGDEGTVVSDVLRPGYVWKGRVVRPAMVKVRG